MLIRVNKKNAATKTAAAASEFSSPSALEELNHRFKDMALTNVPTTANNDLFDDQKLITRTREQVQSKCFNDYINDGRTS